MAEEASFVRRPAHTEAEDWIVYHPDITPTALMLYMRLRGAVMDPSSGAEDWKKEVRLTVDQMRRLLPRTKIKGSTDDYAGKRTVQESLALLVGIGALRRIEAKGFSVPVYDFPMYPPDGHSGPVWGGAVAREIRESVKPRSRTTAGETGGGCDTPHGVRYTARGGATYRTGGCDTPHGSGGLTCGAGGPKETLEEESLSLRAERARESAPAGATAAPRMRDPREAAEAAVKSLRGVFGGKVREDIVNGLTAAIQEGLPPSRAVTCLNGMLGQGVHSPGRVHRANLEALVDPGKADAEQWLREMCTGCDERGETTFEGFAVRPGSSVCRHGQEPVREEMGTKNCISCPRVIPMRAADKCGRCVRTAA